MALAVIGNLLGKEGAKSYSISMGFLALEHQINRQLKKRHLKHIVLACSGGADSMALLEIFRRLQPLQKYKLSVLNIHHGCSQFKKIDKYRQQARKLVKAYCKKHSLHFVGNLTFPKSELKSENELRNFRKKCFKAFLKEQPQALLVTAHHADDLLETRLLQLIRGTGVQGFLSVHGLSENQWMPLKNTSKSDLVTYLHNRDVTWVEDPTNAEQDALRNWLRQTLLPQLELRQKGMVYRLGASLDKLSEALQSMQRSQNKVFTQLNSQIEPIDREAFNQLSSNEKQDFIAWFLRKRGFRSYTENHIHEILKRLDSLQNEYSFSLLKWKWSIDAQHIRVQPLDA